MRRIRVFTPAPLEPRFSMRMPTIYLHPELSITELADLLRMDHGNFSRLLKEMGQSGYLEILRQEKDARYKRIQFTPHGLKVVKQAVDLTERFSVVGLYPLELEERNLLASYFEKISAALGAPQISPIFEEEQYVSALRRLAGVTGMLGLNYLETGMDVYQYQIRYQLMKTEQPDRFAHIADIFPMPRSSLSRFLKKQCEKNVLKRTVDQTDRRVVMFSLGKKEAREFEKVHQSATHVLSKSLEKLKKKDLREAIALIEKSRGYAPSLGTTEKDCFIASEEKDFQDCRAFLIERLVRADLHRSLGPDLLPEQDFLFYSRDESGELIGIASLAEKNKTTAELVQFEESSGSAAEAREFAWQLFTSYAENTGRTEIIIPSGIYSKNPTLFRGLGARSSSGSARQISWVVRDKELVSQRG